MGYLLLLALVVVAGIASVQMARAAEQRSTSQLFFATGFIFIGLGLLAQLALRFSLDENSVRLFYWARGTMALAWFGQGLLVFLLPEHRAARGLSIGLVVAALVTLGLTLMTAVTEAQSWYSTSQPIYGQVGDLLATNRPTRWGALALNIYGVTLLTIGSISWLRQTAPQARTWVTAGMIVLGGLALFAPLYFHPAESNLTFMMELLAPVLLFLGLSGLTASEPSLGSKAR